MSCNTCGTNYTDQITTCACYQYERSHVVVDRVDQVSRFRNKFVTVRNENATYHVDEVGNTIAISRNPIFSDDYVPNVGDYAMVTVYNFAANEFYIFNADGEFKTGVLA